jgi:hypothetical protein
MSMPLLDESTGSNSSGFFSLVYYDYATTRRRLESQKKRRLAKNTADAQNPADRRRSDALES